MGEAGVAVEERLHQPVAGDHGPERGVAAGEPLGHGDDVGLVPVADGAEVLAQPAEGADHLVGDEQHAVAVTDLADPCEVPRRRREAPAGVLDRLQVHRGDGLGPLALDGPADLVGRPAPERHQVVAVDRGTVEVGVGHLDGAGDQWLEGRLEGGDPGDRQRTHGGAVVGDVAAEHLGPGRLAHQPEVLAGELPGRLDRLGAAGGEEHAVAVPGGQDGDALGQLDRPRVGVGPQREVGQLRRLLRRRLGQLGPAVTDLAGEEARKAVEVALAVLVPDIGTLAAHHHRHLVVGAVGPEPGEVHPQMALGPLAQ